MPRCLRLSCFSHALGAAMFAALLTQAGCGGSAFESTVSGKVTLDGQSVGPGSVTFAPAEPTSPPAVGELKTDGSYSVKTSHQRGLAPGSYQVAIQAFEPPPALAPGERVWEPSRPLVPARYMKIATSGLEFTVEPGANFIEIPLTTD